MRLGAQLGGVCMFAKSWQLKHSVLFEQSPASVPILFKSEMHVSAAPVSYDVPVTQMD